MDDLMVYFQQRNNNSNCIKPGYCKYVWMVTN